MTTVLQQPAAPTHVAPLRNLINSKYGQSAIQACNTIWTTASGSSALVSGVQTVIAAGVLAKHQLPTNLEKSIDEQLSTAYRFVDSEESLNKTIDTIDTTIDEKLVEAKSRIGTTIGGATDQLNQAKTQLTETKDTAVLTITETVQTAKTKVTETVRTAKTQLESKVTEFDQNETVNRVVDYVVSYEPAVLTVVNYVLPEEETKEEFEDASDTNEEFALKKTLRLTGNVTLRVSKSVQKRWLLASLQLEKQKQQINSRTEAVKQAIADNSVDLIAYSKSLNENAEYLKGTIYETYVVQAEKAEAFAKSIPTIGISAAGYVLPTIIPSAIAGLNIDLQALELDLSLAALASLPREVAAVVSQSKEMYIDGAIQQLTETKDMIRVKSSEQLQRLGEIIGPVVAPMVAPVVAPLGPFMIRVSSTIALIFGVELNEAQLREHPIVLKLLLFSEGKTGHNQEAKLENAKVESQKEINTCKKNHQEPN